MDRRKARIWKTIWSVLIIAGLLAWTAVFLSIGSAVYAAAKFLKTIQTQKTGISGATAPTTQKPQCTAPHIKYEGYCCLDADENMICDFQQTTTTTTSTTTTTTLTPTTTTTSTTTTTDPCLNKVFDEGELDVDCGGACRKTCDILTLNKSRPQTFKQKSFEYISFTLADEGVKYLLEITSDDVADEASHLPGETGYFDDVAYKILEGDNMRLRIKMWGNPFWFNVSEGRLLLIGGPNCQLGGGFCTRSYNGYTIRLMDRATQKYHINLADDSISIIRLETAVNSPDSDLALAEVKKYVQGGYSIIHVWMI